MAKSVADQFAKSLAAAGVRVCDSLDAIEQTPEVRSLRRQTKGAGND